MDPWSLLTLRGIVVMLDIALVCSRSRALGNIMMLRRWMLVWRWKRRDMRSTIAGVDTLGSIIGCCQEKIGVAALLSRIGSPLGFLTAAFFWLVSLPIFLALLASLFGASTSSVHFLSRILRDKLRIVLKVFRG
jgi:hypothetical protein